jgi:hypothetical protein
MRIAELLVAKGLLTVEGVTQAVAHQQRHGTRLIDSFLALKLVSEEALRTALEQAPAVPTTYENLGLKPEFLFKLLIKAMHVSGLEGITELRDTLTLPAPVVLALMREGVEKKLIEQFGSMRGNSNESRFRLSQAGKDFATEALSLNQYVGPVPVTLEAYQRQIARQAIGRALATAEGVAEAFKDLVVAPEFVRRIGPALNSGRSILLYGPPGNGKSTVAERIGRIYQDVIFIPYSLEVGGEIITVFDPNLHDPADRVEIEALGTDVRREEIDRRWIPCQRPMVITGGELTLEMLDLRFNEIAKFYDAPLHMKALGGVFIIDDFGRQLVRPAELLNRWIIPLERRSDFLKLHTGKQFEVPFDQLVIFSTNLTPTDLMDAAFLRRIPYKIEIGGPSEMEFAEIFVRLCRQQRINVSSQEVIDIVQQLKSIQNSQLARYQAKFIVDQVVASCRYLGVPPRIAPELISDAIANIYARGSAPLLPTLAQAA